MALTKTRKNLLNFSSKKVLLKVFKNYTDARNLKKYIIRFVDESILCKSKIETTILCENAETVFFLPCSPFPPFISSFTLSFGSDCHSCVNLSVWRELVLCDICACMAHFFRLLDCVNNLFTQRKDSYSICFIAGTWVSDFFWRIEVIH